MSHRSTMPRGLMSGDLDHYVEEDNVANGAEIRRERFLVALEKCPTITAAARAIGVARQHIYWWRKCYPDFDHAVQILLDRHHVDRLMAREASR